MEYMVQLENLTKKFDEAYAVDDINLEVRTGEFLTLLGPSGCGKTTTLRMIAGFEKPTSGIVRINGKEVNEVEPYKREVNTVFQSYALFPHMTVFDNIAFGLKMKKVNKDEIKERVHRVLELVQLRDYGNRKPKQLSGGQQQRIAIARAIVNNPKVLLLDEPLGALDLKLRKQMQLELQRLQESLGITFIYVTHDQEEALTMSDRIVVMNAGKIEQIGTPREIYESPKTKFVASFIGETNIIEGVVKEVKGNHALIDYDGEQIVIPVKGQLTVNNKIRMSIRPENIEVFNEKNETQYSFLLEGRVKERIYIGTHTRLVFSLPNGKEIVLNQPNEKLQDIQDQSNIFITWKPERSVVIND